MLEEGGIFAEPKTEQNGLKNYLPKAPILKVCTQMRAQEHNGLLETGVHRPRLFRRVSRMTCFNSTKTCCFWEKPPKSASQHLQNGVLHFSQNSENHPFDPPFEAHKKSSLEMGGLWALICVHLRGHASSKKHGQFRPSKIVPFYIPQFLNRAHMRANCEIGAKRKICTPANN